MIKYDWPVISWTKKRSIVSLSVSEDNCYSPRPKRKHDDEEAESHQLQVKRIRIHFKPTKSPHYESHRIPILLPTFVLPPGVLNTKIITMNVN